MRQLPAPESPEIKLISEYLLDQKSLFYERAWNQIQSQLWQQFVSPERQLLDSDTGSESQRQSSVE